MQGTRENSSYSLPVSDVNKSNSKNVPVDTSLIHQVLFNKKASNNPVTFTVKL